uniref:Uncharacterized protein n=1 Tax=Avena sativa TaxID=4498 RepID=A0ACD5ZEJ9_AVESA
MGQSQPYRWVINAINPTSYSGRPDLARRPRPQLHPYLREASSSPLLPRSVCSPRPSFLLAAPSPTSPSSSPPTLEAGSFWITRSVARMADEEVSDPKALLEANTKAKCVSDWFAYLECVKRIKDDKTGQKHCTGQYFDYLACVDKHVAQKLFDSLK